MIEVNEERIKLHILVSLAKSQRALARMLESAASVADRCDPGAVKLLEHAETISRYQRVLAMRISGIQCRRLRRGKPGKPWISDKLRQIQAISREIDAK